jgi:uronate dehydrogenase
MNDEPQNKPDADEVVLITGAAGRVAHCFIPLLKFGWEMRLTDLKPSFLGSLEISSMDLLNRDTVINKTRGVKSIIHCAIAQYEPYVKKDSAAWNDYHQRMLEVNIKSTFHLLEAARLNGIRQMVYLSSLTIAAGYGPDSSWSESLPPKPIDVYACTKLFGEQLGELYSREHGIHFISLRLGQPYPLGFRQEKAWEADPAANILLTTHHDIARAIDGALNAKHVRYGIFNVLSRNGIQKLDGAKSAEIGFEPRDYWDKRDKSGSHLREIDRNGAL